MDITSLKKVIILVPTLQTGGQERVAVNTAKVLKDRYDVTVVVFNQEDAVFHPDCQIISLNMPATDGTINKVFNAFRRAKALKRLKRELETDVTISFGMTANLANVLSSGWGKTIARISSYGGVLDNILCRFVYGRIDRIICSTRAMEHHMAEIFPKYERKTHVIFNPFDLQDLLEKGSVPVEDYVFSPHTIVRHGRLHEGKNYPRLIRAFFLVQQRVPDAQLLLIGDGPMRDKLQALVSQYGLEGHVTFLGTRKNPFAYLEKSCLYVLSSYIEGFPNALVEGMLFLPAVSVDCLSGPREILSRGAFDASTSGIEIADYGVLVANAEETACNTVISDADHLLAEGILAVLTDQETLSTMKKRARARAESFSLETFQRSLEQLFETL